MARFLSNSFFFIFKYLKINFFVNSDNNNEILKKNDSYRAAHAHSYFLHFESCIKKLFVSNVSSYSEKLINRVQQCGHETPPREVNDIKSLP